MSFLLGCASRCGGFATRTPVRPAGLDAEVESASHFALVVSARLRLALRGLRHPHPREAGGA
ncbi:hypothetical protein, partial [Streptomyces sp. NPDC008139]|uniref:hypothetical protein n=1 Tax=Streptomyces sp. NPDC008139 TaxID=3364814 RepID=UPI0036F10DEE